MSWKLQRCGPVGASEVCVVRKSLLVLTVATVSGLAPAGVSAQATAPDTTYWTPRYLLDYAVVAGGLYVAIVPDLAPAVRARIGPSFDPSNPAAILAPEFSGSLGRPFTPERDWAVSNGFMEAAALGQLVLIPAHELLAARVTGRPLSPHRLHHSILAMSEATASSMGMAALVKAWTGRLRPDFQDRVRHVYCSLPDHAGVDCRGVDPAKLFADTAQALKELRTGRRSFVSGHAATGMTVGTSLALQIGGHWVWGEAATPVSRRGGIAAMAVVGAAGILPGLSRTSLGDGVHHTGDVVAGSLLGAALGGLFYWLHFDARGEPRPGHWTARRRGSGNASAAPGDVRMFTDGARFILQASWPAR
jgi:membrane-associated phospholipid phosphatase